MLMLKAQNRTFARFLLNKTFNLMRRSTSSTPSLDFEKINHPTKVPGKPVVSLNSIKTEKINIDKETIELLVRLSLVNITDE